MADRYGTLTVTSKAMSVQVWFAQDEVTIHPGESTSLSLAIENVSDQTESYTVIPAGLAAGWTIVTRANVTLFAGSRDVIEVVVRPPAIHSTSAGPTSLAVRVIPQGTPDDAMIAEMVATVHPFDDRRVTVLQPLQRGRKRGTFAFMVENQGNNLASCRLHLIDAINRTDGTFDPPAVGVAPGSSSLVRLRLRAKRGFFRRGERQLDFEIEATEQGHEPALGRATLIQPPTIPVGSATKLVAAVGVILLASILWRGLVKPELQDAADRAVDDRMSELTVPTTTVSPVATTIVTEPEPAPVFGAPIGKPVSYRISVDVGIAQDRSESIAVPPESLLHMTDLVLQNPNGDLGTAQLLRNGDVLYAWDLGAMNSANEFQPRVSPLPFEPSDNIVLAVGCDAAGQTSGTGCEIAVLIGGVLVPAELED